jgi:saccharopine dehydrogenase-like NADP-dependent oxidoreductase
MYIIAGGAGEQGRAIIKFLCLHTNEQIISIDPHGEDISADRIQSVRGEFPEALFKLCPPRADKPVVLISCLEPHAALEAQDIACGAGMHYIDLGGDTDTVWRQLEKAQEQDTQGRRLYVIPDCGLAPGVVSSLAGSAERAGSRSAQIFCGGIPIQKEKGYVRSFGIEGLVREYNGTAIWREFGAHCPKQTLYAHQLMVGPYGLEAAPTSGGLSITPWVSDLWRLTYNTLRWRGHFREMRGISEQKQREHLLKFPEVGPYNPDMILLHIIANYNSTMQKW